MFLFSDSQIRLVVGSESVWTYYHTTWAEESMWSPEDIVLDVSSEDGDFWSHFYTDEYLEFHGKRLEIPYLH